MRRGGARQSSFRALPFRQARAHGKEARPRGQGRSVGRLRVLATVLAVIGSGLMAVACAWGGTPEATAMPLGYLPRP
jgi:hypothetical protein